MQLDGSQIITLDAANSKFVVNTSDPQDVGTLSIKLVGTLDDGPSTSADVSFDQEIVANCPEDQVSLVTGLTDDTYYINKGDKTYTASFDHTYDDCPLSFALFEDGSAYSAPWITAFDTTTGQITINTADFATYDLASAVLKVVATSDDSTDATAAAAETSFTLTLKDKCQDAVLSPPTISGQSTYTWDLWAQQTMPFDAMSDDSDAVDNCSTYRYEIVDVTEDYSSFGTIDGLNVKGQPSNNDFSQVKTYTFKIKGFLTDYDATKFITSADVFTVTVENPCIDSSINSQDLSAAGLSTSRLGADDTFQFAEYTDSADVASDAFGDYKCGTYTYSIVESDQTTVPTWITVEATRTLTLSPVLSSPLGVNNLFLKIEMANSNYNGVRYEPFTAEITECVPTISYV